MHLFRRGTVIGFLFAAGSLIAAAVTPASGEATMHLRNAQVTPVSFTALDGWKDDDHAAAFGAFLKSCGAILHGTKAMRAAKPVYGALFKVCERAVAAGTLDRDHARAFFEMNFKPTRITPAGQGSGFFTGYYETEAQGARFPSAEYKFPLYRTPGNVLNHKGGRHIASSLDRTEIENGALAGRSLEICWLKNPVDVFFAQIQGSSRIKLDTGETLRLNYESHNGLPYYPVGKDLIDRGIITKEDMSMDRIREWMEANPDEGKALREKNHSYVFFREVKMADNDECVGSSGVPLTAGRSLAVDKNIHVYGTPIWIEAELPIESDKPETHFRRLLVAQDTGSAIVGPARADIYFGYGEEIGHVAGRIKQHGQFVMLAPSTVEIKGTTEVPLPKPRPGGLVASVAEIHAAAPEVAGSGPSPKPRPKL
jgi:membrane-bound lytic murein transglycosylase A